ncbi:MULTISPECIES: hypothetical protein [Polymorphospora]|uniref:Uncharacterized protein n=1 Tax=Polymorphospora lycopeni TaxID=3140240 RepID=A0ABV5D1Y4_9ACTN
MGEGKKKRTDDREPAGERDERQLSPDWADEAAEARTADDPRARAPHDRTGTPSTGAAR